MRTAISMVAIVVALSALGVVLLGEAPRRLSGERPEDFVQLYVLSWNLRHDGPVYEEIRTPVELEAHLGWSHESDLVFANPPGLLPFLYPISLLRYPIAWWGLLVLSALALPTAVVVAAREIQLPLVPLLTAGVLLLCTPSGLVLLVLNHVESLVVLLSVLGWVALRRGRLMTGGALWGLCAAIKLFPALWILGLLHRRYRPAAYAALVVGVVVTGLGVGIAGFDELAPFLTDALPQSARWRLGSGNFSLVSLGAWLGLLPLGWILAAATALSVGMELFRRPGSPDRILVIGVSASLLISPLSWSYYFPFAAPCLVVLAGHLDLSRVADRLRIYALAVFLFAWPSLLGGWSEGWLDWAPYAVEVTLTFVPTAALVALMVLGLLHVDPPSSRSADVRHPDLPARTPATSP
jgi:alpha-1,2-mannosyltransferase